MPDYATLLTLDVSHSYYGGLCHDFDYLIPGDTALLLRDARMSVRIRDGRLTLFWPRKKNGEPQHPLSGRTLRFGLRLLNPDFVNVTRIEHDPRVEIPLYRNASNAGVLDPPLLAKWSARSLSYLPAGTARPLTVSLKTPRGRTLLETVIIDGVDAVPIPLDLSRFPVGVYQLVETAAGAELSETCYLDPDLRRSSAFGIAEITVAEDFYEAPAEFTIQYQARTETLKYYVVAINYTDKDVEQLAVEDMGHEPGDPDYIPFVKLADPQEDNERNTLKILKGDGLRVVLFKSLFQIPRRKNGLKKIQLTKNGDVLVRHLPQPSAGSCTGDVIVQISK